MSEQGERDVILAILGEGDLLGEMSLIDSIGRSASAVTLENTTVLWMDKNTFNYGLNNPSRYTDPSGQMVDHESDGAGCNTPGSPKCNQIGRRGGGDVLGLKTRLASAGVDLVKDGLFLRPLDRSMEYEADRLGVVVAARGGYDSYGFVAVLTMLAQVKPDESGASITFSTHPSPADRLAELEKVMPQLEKFAQQPHVEGRFRQTVGAK